MPKRTSGTLAGVSQEAFNLLTTSVRLPGLPTDAILALQRIDAEHVVGQRVGNLGVEPGQVSDPPGAERDQAKGQAAADVHEPDAAVRAGAAHRPHDSADGAVGRSEEHTSELQS